MRSFWSDPYLWIHLAGAAAVPLTLELCLLGLAIGDPVFPPIVERLLVLIVGIVPIFLMQWQRPFYIFSVLLVAIRPEYLTIDQRRILRRFKTLGHQILTLLVAIGLGAVLLQLYQVAPLALQPAAQFPQWRGLGLLIASGGFLLSNLFLQVSLSVLRVMLIKETEFALIDPYPIEQIRSNFSIFGLQLKQIVPPLTESQTLAMAAAAAAAPSIQPASPPPVATPVPVPVAEKPEAPKGGEAIAPSPEEASANSPATETPTVTEDEPPLADLVASELIEPIATESSEGANSSEVAAGDLTETEAGNSNQVAEESIEADAIGSEPTAATETTDDQPESPTETTDDQPESPIV